MKNLLRGIALIWIITLVFKIGSFNFVIIISKWLCSFVLITSGNIIPHIGKVETKILYELDVWIIKWLGFGRDSTCTLALRNDGLLVLLRLSSLQDFYQTWKEGIFDIFSWGICPDAVRWLLICTGSRDMTRRLREPLTIWLPIKVSLNREVIIIYKLVLSVDLRVVIDKTLSADLKDILHCWVIIEYFILVCNEDPIMISLNEIVKELDELLLIPLSLVYESISLNVESGKEKNEKLWQNCVACYSVVSVRILKDKIVPGD